MKMTSYTDYSLRALLYIAGHKDRLVTISEIAEFHNVSRNHMTKVINNLSRNDFIATVRGKSGGIRLSREPEDIILADVIYNTEQHMNLAECFDREINTCPIIGGCKLMKILYEARRGFMSPFENATLANIL